MFRFIFTTLFFALLLSSNSVFAQKMSKEQKKIWEKRQKSMPVEEFKQKMETQETATDEAYKLERQVLSMTKALAERERQIDSLEEALANKKETKSAKKQNVTNTENEDSASSSSDATQDDYSKGTVYRVQVGAFRNKDLMKFVGHRRFHAEADEDGVKKYTIAVFRDYWEADLFKKYMREMGVNDAWIVSYKDGVRVQIESVLSAEDQKIVKSGDSKNDDVD